MAVFFGVNMRALDDCGRPVEIILSGELGKRFGKKHTRRINHAYEAGVSLAHTIPGFESFMIKSEERGLKFAVYLDGENISEEDLTKRGSHSFDVVRIVPVIAGSKKAGALQLIIGVALIIASIWMPGLAIVASDMLFAAGAAVALGEPSKCYHLSPLGWRVVSHQTIKPHTALVAQKTQPLRATRWACSTESAGLAARLFPPGFM